MDDLDEVRAALGYNKIDLVGLSYGTIASQVYMRQHPEHVRSAFLVGVATPNIKQPLLFPRSAQHAMDLLFADCTADETCHSAFPRLQEEFGVVLSRFNQGPLPVEMIDPVSKKRVQVKLSRSSFVEGIRLAMYSTDRSSSSPKLFIRLMKTITCHSRRRPSISVPAQAWRAVFTSPSHVQKACHLSPRKSLADETQEYLRRRRARPTPHYRLQGLA